MEALCLSRIPAQRTNGAFPGGQRLIDTLGLCDFSKALFASAHAMTQTHHLSAFMFSPDLKPRTLLAENAGLAALAKTAAQVYCEKYWPYDLANNVLQKTPLNENDSLCVRTSASEISEIEYKFQCYTAAGVADRVSVLRREKDRNIRLNFYSRAGKKFSDNEFSNIINWSGIFISMIVKHDSIVNLSRPTHSDSFSEKLRMLPISLPTREIEVCDAILQGISSEGIALKLNLSINTVRTYRKRAYARLGISSQNELMRLISRQSQLA